MRILCRPARTRQAARPRPLNAAERQPDRLANAVAAPRTMRSGRMRRACTHFDTPCFEACPRRARRGSGSTRRCSRRSPLQYFAELQAQLVVFVAAKLRKLVRRGLWVSRRRGGFLEGEHLVAVSLASRSSERAQAKTPRALARGVFDKPGDTYFRECSHYHRPGVLNYCVRNGNRCFHYGMVARKVRRAVKPSRA